MRVVSKVIYTSFFKILVLSRTFLRFVGTINSCPSPPPPMLSNMSKAVVGQ